MDQTLTLRRSRPEDLADVDALLARCFPRLLSRDYPPSVMVTAVPLMSRARPGLVGSPGYFVAADPEGRIVAAGGWSSGPRDRGVRGAGLGHVRHVATDPDLVRRGIGRALMRRVLQDAAGAGVGVMECLATRTAEPFYAALGFRRIGAVDVTLQPGIVFPAVRMVHQL
jgi:GNAT superfamily N-acetyltransferase